MNNTRDCKNCENCDFVWGFMCTCHYSYDADRYHHQVGQVVHRGEASKCERYSTEPYNRDEVFVL